MYLPLGRKREDTCTYLPSHRQRERERHMYLPAITQTETERERERERHMYLPAITQRERDACTCLQLDRPQERGRPIPTYH